ncbi:hypothetical protein IKS57_05590 [bacterium]|nr:hypothetical protein [bacterium]
MNIFKKVILKPFKKEKPLTYQIYEYLKKNAVGYEKRVKSSVLMKEFNIKDNKSLRGYIEDIRNSEILQKIVCSEAGKQGGYWIATNDEEVYQTLAHLYKRSMQMLKTYSIIRKKHKLDNQYRLKLSKYEKEIYESVMR